MPPINQQGSRAGLITTLVVFAILFIVSSVFAFQFYGKWQVSEATHKDYQKRYMDLLPEALLQIPSVEALRTARTEQPPKLGVTSGDSVLQAAIHQRDALAGVIRGVSDTSDNPAAPAAADAAKTLLDASTKLKGANVDVAVPTAGLDNAIDSLTSGLIAQKATISSLSAQLADTTAKLTAAQNDTKAAVDANKLAMTSQATADQDAIAKANAATDAIKSKYDEIQAAIAANGTQVTADTAVRDAALADAKKQISDRDKEIAELKSRLSNHRPSVENAAVRQADGKLVRVASNGICYINLGFGDQVTPGLTFEIYDKAEGVPGIPDNATADEQLPVGKGSIEITHVGTTSSECRIVKITPGAVLTEGDLIANLVYDPHTKYNFFVYGDFDLANNGRPNAPDADVIKRLITQWGGRVASVDPANPGKDVKPNIDFLVLGAEPVVPSFSKDDITAENQEKINKAQEKLAQYTEVEAAAKDLHIPIMNQNRFLYYVGFYDQAKR